MKYLQVFGGREMRAAENRFHNRENYAVSLHYYNVVSHSWSVLAPGTRCIPMGRRSHSSCRL